MNTRAAKAFYDGVSEYLPVPAPDKGAYIVNISLTICTCLSFIHKGQPYFVSIYMQSIMAEVILLQRTMLFAIFCKHLHAEHRAETIFLQRTLLFVAFFISFQVVPCFFVSSVNYYLPPFLLVCLVFFFLGSSS